MDETEKPSFFHTMEFNTWIITTFFSVLISVFCVMLPVAGIHALGVAAGQELSRYDGPAEREVWVPKPVQRADVPIVFRSRTAL
ncbi:MAG: hypothetical protein AAB554_03370 [Patescibacteria group bacterium]